MTDEEQKAWDMFAAAALTGILASPKEISHNGKPDGITQNSIADMAGQLADAMMEQRKARMG